MKRTASVAIFSCFFLWAPAPADAEPDAKTIPVTADASVEPGAKLPDKVPEDIGGAIGTASSIIKAAKLKNWWLASAGVIWLVMFIMKALGLFQRIGKRWAYIVVGLLSMAAMLASKFGGGVSWEAAMAVMTSGPFMAYSNDLVKRGLLAREPTTELKRMT